MVGLVEEEGSVYVGTLVPVRGSMTVTGGWTMILGWIWVMLVVVRFPVEEEGGDSLLRRLEESIARLAGV